MKRGIILVTAQFEDTGPSSRISTLLEILENELTPHQRYAVTECLLHDRTFTDVARECGVSVGTISRNYHRGLKKLERFSKYCT